MSSPFTALQSRLGVVRIEPHMLAQVQALMHAKVPELALIQQTQSNFHLTSSLLDFHDEGKPVNSRVLALWDEHLKPVLPHLNYTIHSPAILMHWAKNWLMQMYVLPSALRYNVLYANSQIDYATLVACVRDNANALVYGEDQHQNTEEDSDILFNHYYKEGLAYHMVFIKMHHTELAPIEGARRWLLSEYNWVVYAEAIPMSEDQFLIHTQECAEAIRAMYSARHHDEAVKWPRVSDTVWQSLVNVKLFWLGLLAKHNPNLYLSDDPDAPDQPFAHLATYLPDEVRQIH